MKEAVALVGAAALLGWVVGQVMISTLQPVIAALSNHPL